MTAILPELLPWPPGSNSRTVTLADLDTGPLTAQWRVSADGCGQRIELTCRSRELWRLLISHRARHDITFHVFHGTRDRRPFSYFAVGIRPQDYDEIVSSPAIQHHLAAHIEH